MNYASQNQPFEYITQQSSDCNWWSKDHVDIATCHNPVNLKAFVFIHGVFSSFLLSKHLTWYATIILFDLVPYVGLHK